MATLPEGYHTEEWTYIGKNIGAKTGKLLETWLRPDGEEVLHVTTTGGPIGATFTVTVNDDRTRMYTSGSLGPQYLRSADRDDPRLPSWTARSREEATLHALTQQQARAKRQPDALSEALRPIRALYQKNVTPARRAAFLALVIEEITRWKAKEDV